jgi:hypothetical protein
METVSLWQFLKESWKDAHEDMTFRSVVQQAFIRFVSTRPVLLLLMAVFFHYQIFPSHIPQLKSLSGEVQFIYQVVAFIGTLILAFWFVKPVIKLILPTTTFFDFGTLILDFAEKCLMLYVGLIAIQFWGIEIVAVLKQIILNPIVALSTFFGLFFLWILFRVPRQIHSIVSSFHVIKKLDPPKNPCPGQDIAKVAVHEAGHVLLYALWPQVPSDLHAKVSSELGPEDTYRGWVGYSDTKPDSDLCTENELRLRMFRNLAGSVAEKVIVGERWLGSNSDLEQWLNTATHFLEAGFGEVFYANDSSEAHVAHNRSVLNALKASQEADMIDFFTANEKLLRDLAAVIATKKELKYHEIKPYLDQVIVTSKMQPLKGKI